MRNNKKIGKSGLELTLSKEQQQFILHWGEMGSRWSISRAVAQIQALLLVSETPLNAEQISATLNLARSNVSTGLKELQSWGLASVSHVLGDRRDHFVANKDIWEMLGLIADRRIERELIPTLEFIKTLRANQTQGTSSFSKLITELEQLLDGGISFYRQIRKLPRPIAKQLIKLDGKISKFLKTKS